jgi:hypothetical protein
MKNSLSELSMRLAMIVVGEGKAAEGDMVGAEGGGLV